MTSADSLRGEAHGAGTFAAPTAAGRPAKDGFGSDTDEIGSECHILPHFNPNTNANADLIGYEYKTDSSNPDTNPDTFSI